MQSADMISPKILSAGLPPLDPLLRGDIITMRCRDSAWLAGFVMDIIVRNYRPGMRMLYLHWVDYHERFWTLDYDGMVRMAKRAGVDPKRFADDAYFVRSFSRDNNEVEENWKRLFDSGKFDLIVLDSVSELYAPPREPGTRYWRAGTGNHATKPEPRNTKPEQNQNTKPMLYSIGRFIQLCIRNDCIGIALDYSPRMHPYLAHTSTIIIDFEIDRHEVAATILKHPFLPEETFLIPRDRQYKLGRWM